MRPAPANWASGESPSVGVAVCVTSLPYDARCPGLCSPAMEEERTGGSSATWVTRPRPVVGGSTGSTREAPVPAQASPSGERNASWIERRQGSQVLTVSAETEAIDEAERVLDEVEAALGRLDHGTYGTCSTCGEAIDDERLADQPTVQICGSCSASPSPGLLEVTAAPWDPEGLPG